MIGGDSQMESPAATVAASWGEPSGIILVPLDGSVEAKSALAPAQLISGVTGAPVHVLHVSDEHLPSRALAARLLLSPRELRQVFLRQSTGSPSEAIVRDAAEKRAILIVMTTRGKTDYQGRVLRGVPEHVLMHALCPVMLLRPEIGSAVAGLRKLERILLPLDGAPSTMAVVGPAVNLAAQSAAALDLLYVAQPHARQVGEPGTFNVPRYVDQPQHEWPAWAREYVDRLCSCIGACQTDGVRRIFLRHGEPTEEILQFAAKAESQLIVLEWRGRFDPAHATIVHGVLRASPCPVLLIRTTPLT